MVDKRVFLRGVDEFGAIGLDLVNVLQVLNVFIPVWGRTGTRGSAASDGSIDR